MRRNQVPERDGVGLAAGDGSVNFHRQFKVTPSGSISSSTKAQFIAPPPRGTLRVKSEKCPTEV